MKKIFLLIIVIIQLSCSGESAKAPIEKNNTNSSCDKQLDSLKHVISNQNDSIVKLTQIIDDQMDSIVKLNGGVKADDYWENNVPKDTLSENYK